MRWGSGDERARRYFEVEGSEICAAAHARRTFGLRVTAEEFPLVPLSEPYDVVCMWDTVEHPFQARIQGRRWRLIHR